MWTALDERQLYVAADNPENHKLFDHLSLQTFIMPPHSSPQEGTELMTTLRNVFELKFVAVGQTPGIIEVRAPQPILAACTKLMAQLNQDRPEVMLDMRVYEIDHQLAKNIGVHIPDTFNLYNIPIGRPGGTGGTEYSALINQLISSGGINQANSSSQSQRCWRSCRGRRG
jgi:general secretion pathway protein D